VEAVVTRPLFSTGHSLLIPEGSRLVGDVVMAQPARCLHRNGKVLFCVPPNQLPAGAVEGIQGYLEGVEADFDAHLALDQEGPRHATSPKTRFIFPAIAMAVAGLSFASGLQCPGCSRSRHGRPRRIGGRGTRVDWHPVAQASRTLAFGHRLHRRWVQRLLNLHRARRGRCSPGEHTGQSQPRGARR